MVIELRIEKTRLLGAMATALRGHENGELPA
jgi:hypothetical protein